MGNLTLTRFTAYAYSYAMNQNSNVTLSEKYLDLDLHGRKEPESGILNIKNICIRDRQT